MPRVVILRDAATSRFRVSTTEPFGRVTVALVTQFALVVGSLPRPRAGSVCSARARAVERPGPARDEKRHEQRRLEALSAGARWMNTAPLGGMSGLSIVGSNHPRGQTHKSDPDRSTWGAVAGRSSGLLSEANCAGGREEEAARRGGCAPSAPLARTVHERPRPGVCESGPPRRPRALTPTASRQAGPYLSPSDVPGHAI